MDFSFVRRSSKDASGEDDDRATALKNSITEGSSRIFGSVMAKKTGLLDGLSSKFDQVTQALNTEEQPQQQTRTTRAASLGGDSNNAASPQLSRPKSRVPPPKPPAPSIESRLNGQLSRQYSADPGSTSNYLPSTRATSSLAKQGRQVSLPAHVLHPSDEYKSPLGRTGILHGIPSLAKANQLPSKESSTDYNSKNSFSGVNDVLAEIRPEAIDSGSKTTYDTSNNTTEVSVVTDNYVPYTSPYASAGKPSAYSSEATSSSELLSGLSATTTPSNSYTRGNAPDSSTLLAPRQKDKDLLVITPTSGAALPMPSIKPTSPPEVGQKGGYDSDGGDSSATEGCDEVLSDPEDLDYNGDLNLAGTSTGGAPNFNTDGMDDLSKECLTFMEGFVNKMFTSQSLTQGDKAKFGELCQQWPGRLWFSRFVNAQRMNKKVEEQVFFQLVQFFIVCLFECNVSEDYIPAKTLMSMCFTFYYEVSQPTSGDNVKHFLYSFLKDQQIWQETRFWKAAFFDAVQQERARKPIIRRSDGTEAKIDDKEFQENITFGQLGTFSANMRAFGINKDLVIEFIRKQASIANLREEQVDMLRENMDKWND